MVSILLVGLIKGVETKRVAQQLTIWRNLTEGIQIVRKNKVVLALMLMAATCEMFGFSFPVLVPVFARDILKVGAIGNGMINAFRSGGGLLASLALASLGDFTHKGNLLWGMFLMFGVMALILAFKPYGLFSYRGIH